MMAGSGAFRRFRTGLLLLVLVLVGLTTWQTRLRSTDWDLPLWVTVYPINADGSERSSEYIASLDNDSLQAIEVFMSGEAARYALSLHDPATLRLGPEVKEHPPAPPRDGNFLKIAWWSLTLRRWANRVDALDGPPPDVRIFALYFDPETHAVLPHSLGLQKGLIGVANLYAAERMAQSNNVVMLHELLHTLGATDKYDPRNGMPRYPDGYADPARQPRYPQERAEIMGGRVALSPTEAETPASLDSVVIGAKTAMEINWRR